VVLLKYLGNKVQRFLREQGNAQWKFWFRDVDSNHDTQLQRLMSYRLDDPGSVVFSVDCQAACCILVHHCPRFVPVFMELGKLAARFHDIGFGDDIVAVKNRMR
jgi:hypothetical protein